MISAASEQARTGRQCGQCSLCCKLLHVVELNKPANQWCGHCKPGSGGCTIHAKRPNICREYFCGWMLTRNVGDDWYPLRCHMVISLGKLGGIQTVTITVDGKYPRVWLEQGYHNQLRALALRGLRVESQENVHLVQVRCNNRVWLVLPDRDVEITTGSYIVKLVNQSEWDVEQFATGSAAEARVEVLMGAR
jgi:hypothetical protein